LFKVSDVMLVNLLFPEKVKDVLHLCQRDSTVDKAALFIVANNYHFTHKDKTNN